jgi:RNA recognition motif-containing protein
MNTFYSQFAVFIRNLSWKASESDVRKAFEHAVGGVEGVYLLPSKIEGGAGHQGCGFVYFENEHYQQAALNDDHTLTICNRPVIIQTALPRRQKNPSTPEKESVQSR